ncbi:N-acetyl-anhydromuranmyl-L-alanine amidase, partial [Salmonella enterica subsp. enterica]
EFGGPWIDALFTGTIDVQTPILFLSEIAHLRVSAHCLIRRDGEIVQYVPFDKRAWHAGVSNYQGRERCNDFSIGIELEGTDTLAYTDAQYQQLAAVTRTLIASYPAIADNMTGHCNIAPDRKTDPGPAFDWPRFRALVALSSHKEMT